MQIALDDEEAGFDAPPEAINFAEMDPTISLLVQQGGEQYFRLACGQGNADKPIGNSSFGCDCNPHFEECFPGFVLQWLGNDGLLFATFNKGFDGIAESDGDSDNAVGAEVLM